MQVRMLNRIVGKRQVGVVAVVSALCVAWPDDHQRIDIGSFHTDCTMIAESLGWKATTSLDDGLAATAIFYRSHPSYLSST